MKLNMIWYNIGTIYKSTINSGSIDIKALEFTSRINGRPRRMYLGTYCKFTKKL